MHGIHAQAPTMKLRRKIVGEHFADEIDALYADASPTR
jgi:hypothetical protein